MFSVLASRLSNASDAEWITTFKALVENVESPDSQVQAPNKRDISQGFTLIETKLASISGGCEEVVNVLLDTLRVLLRFRENVEASLTAKLMSHLLNISEESVAESLLNAQLAARCLINFLFENPQNVNVFLSVKVDGLARIVRILNRHCEWCNVWTAELNNLHYFLVRAVHMIVSQNDTVCAQLSPSSELTSSLVVALVRRLSKTVANTDTGTAGTTGKSTSSTGGGSSGEGGGGSGTSTSGVGGTGGASGTGGAGSFPYTECNGKLYLETGRLLFALECHDVLATHNTSGTTGTGAVGGGSSSGSGSGSGSGDSYETNPLTKVLIVTVLSAILNSTTPYTTTNNTVTTLTTLQQQCQDVSIQLAMYLPTHSYHDPSVINELSKLTQIQMQLQMQVQTPVQMQVQDTRIGDDSVSNENPHRRRDHSLLQGPAGDCLYDYSDTSNNASSSSGGDSGCSGDSGSGGTCGSADAAINTNTSTNTNTNTNTNITDTDTTHEPAVVVHIVPYLLSVLHRQLLQAHGESTDTGSGDSIKSVKTNVAMRPSEQSALLTPMLVLLTNLCTHSHTARAATKSTIFPSVYNPTSTTHLTTAGTAKMDPTDVPYGTIRYYVVGFMTSLDSQLKRCAAELVYVLCDEDADEFTARTGFGNAVALLQIKGLC